MPRKPLEELTDDDLEALADLVARHALVIEREALRSARMSEREAAHALRMSKTGLRVIQRRAIVHIATWIVLLLLQQEDASRLPRRTTKARDC